MAQGPACAITPLGSLEGSSADEGKASKKDDILIIIVDKNKMNDNAFDKKISKPKT